MRNVHLVHGGSCKYCTFLVGRIGLEPTTHGEIKDGQPAKGIPYDLMFKTREARVTEWHDSPVGDASPGTFERTVAEVP
jgi:hypothetical protein